jgi:isopenicillin N synthase-like dioxygenase
MAVSASLPIIDFESIHNTDADPMVRKQIMQQIDAACREYG